MFVTSLFPVTLGFTVIVLFGSNVRSIDESNFGEVVFVNVLFRHGDRTPSKVYKKDPYQKWDLGLGELTNKGKEQEYELGKWLRERYNSLLTEKYRPDIIYVQATDVDRVLMSAECCLAAMYPPKDDQIWNKELNWQPIPVHTKPDKKDRLLAQHENCPAYKKELARVETSEEIQKIYDKYADVIKTLKENSGEEKINYKVIHNIYDALLVEETLGYKLPEWTDKIYPEPLKNVAILKYTLPTWTESLGRLKAGPLIKEMVENMKKKSENKTTHNVRMYAAHDTTISNVLNTLKMFDPIPPPYAACLMIELRKDAEGKFTVTTFYRNSTTEGPVLLTLPHCTGACPLDDFISLTKPYTPDDWDKECQDKQQLLNLKSGWFLLDTIKI